MAVTIDWANLVVECTSSITDLPAFHAELRAAEDDAIGMLYPTIHTWKALDLGGGAFFYGMDFINGWELKFTAPGNYTINGNLNASIQPVASVYVERRTSAAFATTAVGGSGPSAESIADAVRAELASDLLKLAELHLIHGLQAGSPLVVKTNERTAGTVEQDLSETGGTVTVARR